MRKENNEDGMRTVNITKWNLSLSINQYKEKILETWLTENCRYDLVTGFALKVQFHTSIIFRDKELKKLKD